MKIWYEADELDLFTCEHAASEKQEMENPDEI